MLTKAVDHKLYKIITLIRLDGIIQEPTRQGIKYFGSCKLAKAYGLKAWCCCKVVAWRIMVAAVIFPVAFAHMVRKGLAGLGIDVTFKGVTAMPAVWAQVSAAPAVVGFEDVTVHGMVKKVPLPGGGADGLCVKGRGGFLRQAE